MITIEGISTPAPVTKFVEAKTLIKMGRVNTGIRVNKNIAQGLVSHRLIVSDSEGYWTLTQLGRKVFQATEYVEIEVPLDLFLRIDSEKVIAGQVLDSKFSLWKMMVNTCVACKRDAESLSLIEDLDGNNDAYCKDCLDKGYDFAINNAKTNRLAAII